MSPLMTLAFHQCFSKVLFVYKEFCDYVTIRVGRLTFDAVLFSVVALQTLDISQGTVATHLRCEWIFSDSIITIFLLILIVK